MWRDLLFQKNPMRIFERCIRGGLGKGNLGVFMARSGVGKSACLIQISLDNLLKGKNVLHFCFGQRVEKVREWYDEILDDLIHSYNLSQAIEISEEIESRRMILAYPDNVFDIDRMDAGLKRLIQHGGFLPEVVFIDGYAFETLSRSDLERMKSMAEANNLEVWFAVKTHREGFTANERGIPAPCHLIDDLLSVIVFLEPMEDSVRLRLLKDHNNPDLLDLHLLLDQNTLLIKDEVSREMRA